MFKIAVAAKKAAEEDAKKATESSGEWPKKPEEEVPATEIKPAAAVKEAEGEVSPENATKTKDDQPVTESKSAADLKAEASAAKGAECGCIIV
jgi:hypothetical protein